MRKIGFLIAAAAIAGFASAAFAKEKPPTPGDLNKLVKELCGTPGQNALDLPANEFAKQRNAVRKGDSWLPPCNILEPLAAGAPD